MDDSIYYGEWNKKTNKMHGRGFIKYEDGGRYDGYWINNKRHIYG